MFSAGTETTAMTTEWKMALLLNHRTRRSSRKHRKRLTRPWGPPGSSPQTTCRGSATCTSPPPTAQSLLPSVTVTMSRKSMLSETTDSSLLKHRYCMVPDELKTSVATMTSNSNAYVDIICPSLLWVHSSDRSVDVSSSVTARYKTQSVFSL
jgi:hypothetical protein